MPRSFNKAASSFLGFHLALELLLHLRHTYFSVTIYALNRKRTLPRPFAVAVFSAFRADVLASSDIIRFQRKHAKLAAAHVPRRMIKAIARRDFFLFNKRIDLREFDFRHLTTLCCFVRKKNIKLYWVEAMLHPNCAKLKVCTLFASTAISDTCSRRARG